jgi:hypothetical protein
MTPNSIEMLKIYNRDYDAEGVVKMLDHAGYDLRDLSRYVFYPYALIDLGVWAQARLLMEETGISPLTDPLLLRKSIEERRATEQKEATNEFAAIMENPQLRADYILNVLKQPPTIHKFIDWDVVQQDFVIKKRKVNPFLQYIKYWRIGKRETNLWDFMLQQNPTIGEQIRQRANKLNTCL